MRYCTRCIYPANHPLYITFDKAGVCSGCRVHQEKDELDWNERLERLKQITKSYKAKSRGIHDCIIPVSGGRDSYFIVHMAKNILGLHPLLVTYNKHYNTQIGIRNLSHLRTYLGCDIVTMTVSPERIKRITAESLKKRGSIYWHCLAGQSVFPVQIATKFKIPLIIWGEHQGVDQVGMYSHLDEVEMTRKYRKEHDLMGLEAVDLLRNAEDLTESDLTQFIYPHDKELESVGVRGLYLGNFIPWDSKTQHELMIKTYNYESGVQQRTFDTYNDVDCFHYSGLHDYIKFIKWGYGKVTDHACREIRLHRMTREEGIDLVNKYDSVKPRDISIFLNWIGIPEEQLWSMVDHYRDSRIWYKDSHHLWKRHDTINKHRGDGNVDAARLKIWGGSEFIVTPPKVANYVDNQYTLIGRGWVDDLL